jgi:hypothetical protein
VARPSYDLIWELREPTAKNPDVGLNWLVRSTESLRRHDGKPNVAAIGRLTGISYSALNAILPTRRGQRDFRTPDARTITRIAVAGALVNRVSPEYAHSKIFQLPIATEAIADLEARLAELGDAEASRA